MALSECKFVVQSQSKYKSIILRGRSGAAIAAAAESELAEPVSGRSSILADKLDIAAATAISTSAEDAAAN